VAARSDNEDFSDVDNAWFDGNDKSDHGEDENDSDAEVAEHAASAALYFSRLCVQLCANDPSVFPRGPNLPFLIDEHVPDSSCEELAEALTQNTIIRCMRFYLEGRSA
jgi:hypothetical protein